MVDLFEVQFYIKDNYYHFEAGQVRQVLSFCPTGHIPEGFIENWPPDPARRAVISTDSTYQGLYSQIML